jgi:hypothetical protein
MEENKQNLTEDDITWQALLNWMAYMLQKREREENK